MLIINHKAFSVSGNSKVLFRFFVPNFSCFQTRLNMRPRKIPSCLLKTLSKERLSAKLHNKICQSQHRSFNNPNLEVIWHLSQTHKTLLFSLFFLPKGHAIALSQQASEYSQKARKDVGTTIFSLNFPKLFYRYFY